MNVFELFGKIAIDGSGAMSGIDQTVGHAKKAESNLSKTFKRIGSAVAAAFTVRAIVDFGKQCTQAYASIAAEESAFAQIMGDYADTAQAKLNAVSDATGVSATRMTGAMTSLTAKFKGLGYDTADATTLATDGLLIAADAAAFWDMSLDESMSHLNSFINGSYEGGEAIGLFANDTQMAAYAIEQGIVKDAKAWAKLDEAQRQATRLAYAKQMMESSGATGQAAKEADAYANVMANLKESWRQFQGVIGKPILEKIVLPAMQKLNNFLPKLTESVQNGITWLDEGFSKIKGYFEDVFTEHGIKWEALPDAMSKTFKGIERKVGGWLSGVGQKVQNTWNNTVWPAIQSLASTFGIELPDIDLGSIFASFNTAYESVKATASTFYTDVKAAFAKDADGKIQLDEALSGMFDAGVKAIEGLLTSAGTLVTDIVGKITGNEEGAKQIGEVFSELFGIGSEVITGVKDGVVAVFGWFLQNGDTVGPIIRDVATAMALFALASPATAIIAAIGALITALTVDWGEFESNYPELVKLFEDLTGLDFTNVATGLTNFQTEFGKLIEWFKSNESVVNFMIAALGAIAYGSGNVVLGTALTMYAAKKEYEEAQKTVENAAEKHSIIKEPKTTVEGDGAGTHQTDNGEQGGDGGHWEERWMPQLRNWRQYPDLDIDGTGGSTGLPGLIGAIQSLIASNQSMKGDVTAAIADGLSGITVTGSISTGNITLDSGVLVGQLTPRLDLKLGSKMGRA